MTEKYSFLTFFIRLTKIALLFIGLFLFVKLPIIAQNVSYIFDEISFANTQNQPLNLALAGGLNSPQFSTIDLNGDNKNDLFIFDRSTNRIFTFLAENNRYRYAPEYEIIFPSLQNWCLLVDYDKDGKKDIFTATNSSVAVYKNTGIANSNVNFSTKPKILTTKNISATAQINIGIDATDMPAITDVDNDGDIDMIFFTPAVGVNVEWVRNMSVEKYQKTDSLEFEKVTTRWGEFEECSQCNDFKFGTNSCFSAEKLEDEINQKQILRVEHSGSSQLLLDLNGDGLKDMLLGDISCNNLSAFINKGTRTEAKFDSFIQNFPQNNPVDLHVFPAAYYEDVDFDGVKDLLVSPNTYDNSDKLTNFRQSVWFYKNVGTENNPNFTLISKDFLQSQMLDFGEYAKPVTVDVDNDGDIDLLVANGGSLQTDKSYKTQLFYYENIGTTAQPNFVLRNENLWNFLSINGLYLRPTFADLNNDNALDLIFTIANQQNATNLYYVLNENTAQQALNFDLTKRKTFEINTTFRPFDEPLLVDINSDNRKDLLLGRLRGNVEYWENTGNFSFTLQNENVGNLLANNASLMSLATADLNNDGKLELITGNNKGELQVYNNFIANINTNVVAMPSIIRHKISNLHLKHNFGGATCPAVFGKDIFVGTQTGGLHFLRFSQVLTNIDDEISANFDFTFYPNPTTNTIKLQSRTSLQLTLHNILGQKMQFPSILQADILLECEMKNLSVGLYILTVQDAEGKKKMYKIMKE
jgi:hypothetical protein